MLNIHPLFVHFPLALLPAAVLLDILGARWGKESLRSGGWWCRVLGTAGAIGAAITGLLAGRSVPHPEAVHSIMETHETLGLSTLGIFLALLIWRSLNKNFLPQHRALALAYFVIALAGVTVMFFGARLGGEMVYEHGVGGSAVRFPEAGDHTHGDMENPHKPHGTYEQGGDEGSHEHRRTSGDVKGDKEREGEIHLHGEGTEHEH